MEFAIVEKKNGVKNIVFYISKTEKFLKFVKKSIETNDYIQIGNVMETDILENNFFKPFKYLVDNTNKIIYLEKKEIIIPGYVYNTKKLEINVLCSWELIAQKEINTTCTLNIKSNYLDKELCFTNNFEEKYFEPLAQIDSDNESQFFSDISNSSEIFEKNDTIIYYNDQDKLMDEIEYLDDTDTDMLFEYFANPDKLC